MHEAIREYWNGRAKTYAQDITRELVPGTEEAWLAVFSEHACLSGAESLRVLDVGTGPGYFARLFAQAGHRVEAVDWSPAMVEQARALAKEYKDMVNVQVADAAALPFPDESFDLVVTRNLTWTLPDPEAAYAEWHRVLKPGGSLVVFDANWYGYLASAEGMPPQNKNWSAGASPKQCAECEEIARTMPLTYKSRPVWDVEALSNTGFTSVKADVEVWQRVWNEDERKSYAETPLFLVSARR